MCFNKTNLNLRGEGVVNDKRQKTLHYYLLSKYIGKIILHRLGSGKTRLSDAYLLKIKNKNQKRFCLGYFGTDITNRQGNHLSYSKVFSCSLQIKVFIKKILVVPA